MTIEKQEIKTPIPLIVNIFKRIYRNNNTLTVKALCVTKVINSKTSLLDTDLIKIDTQDERDIATIKFTFKNGIPLIKCWRINHYSLEISIEKALTLDIQNKLIVNYRDEHQGRIIYNAFDLKKGQNRNSKVFVENGTSLYFRQTIKNTMYLTVRETNEYDHLKNRIRVLASYLLSKLSFNKDIVLMYEKECEKYEESASVLYEKIIDLGYKKVFYILNRDNKVFADLESKYKENIIEKGSFKHLLYFFKCRKFIGTETLGHAIQLRAANRFIVNKVQSKKLSYVFLQHGVMYMISLDADLRSGFRQQGLELYRVVVSSEAEAQHFIELGGFSREELYITGLAKFDRSYRYDNADKIVVMVTWRRWETNQAAIDFTKTKYYKMLERIESAVPEELKEKLIILPHPLMRKAMENSVSRLNKYFPLEDTYDEILRECDTLITDYSSIACDAFYRGSKVIFYWEEKDECLAHYGEQAKLMLNEENAFGDVVYSENALLSVFQNNYMNEQTEKYQNSYRKIVSFHDGQNTARLIDELIKDKILN